MNLRLGRFGKQESACAVGLAALVSGVFSVNVGDTFARGNLCYAATAAGVLLSLLLLHLLDRAMVRLGARELANLLSGGLRFLALPLALGLVLSAVLPLFRFTLAMERYIYVEADYVPVVLYLLPVLFIMVLCGMECIARMGKLLLIPAVLALALTLLLASPAFAVHHLFPLFSPGFPAFLEQTGSALLRFLAPGLALFAVGTGCQGRKNTLGGVDRGLLLGGAGAALLHLGLGLTFFGPDMASMTAPVYCMTMAARQERLGLRLDVLVLFLWVAAGLVAAAFYLYAAALLLCRTMGVEDNRPVGALLSAVRLIYRRGYLLLALPALLLWGRSLLHRRRP